MHMHGCMPAYISIYTYKHIYFWSLMKINALICLFRDNLSSWGHSIEMRGEIIPKPSSDSGQSVRWNIKLSNKFHIIGRYCTSCLKRYTSVSVFQLSRPVQVKLRDRWDHSRVLVFIFQDTDGARNYTHFLHQRWLYRPWNRTYCFRWLENLVLSFYRRRTNGAYTHRLPCTQTMTRVICSNTVR